MRKRARVLCLLMALFPIKAIADESPVGISYVDTNDLNLYYYNSLSYLVPHAVRTFTNSVAWQRRMFGWTPSEPTAVLLQDFADYGGATVLATPRSLVLLEVSPLSQAFETFPASERMYQLMNHELVHVVQGDIANDEDRRWRRFFLGKVAPDGKDPETLLYYYLTVPRYSAPRWWMEGSAVFAETWMAGGLGRAQGGYDEMVFRAMVRDNGHFYDPLGLVSRGVKVDFQFLANAYLYGTRFFTWLAYQYSPEKALEWVRRDEGSKRYYYDQFELVFGRPLEQAWQDWISFEQGFQRQNLTKIRQFSVTSYRTLAGSPVGSVSRTYYDEATGMLYGAFRYAGTVEYIGALNTHDGTISRLADVKRAALYRVCSFAFDPSTGTAFFTNDNQGHFSYRDLMAVDVRTGAERMLIENGRIGEFAVDPVDHSLIGVRHANGLATLVRIPPPYNLWNELYTFPYGVVPYDLDISPDGSLLSASVAEVSGDQFLRVWELQRVMNGDMKPLSEFRFGQSVPESFVFSKDGRYLYGSSYYTGVSNIFRYEVATGTIEAVTNAEIGFFRPTPLSDGRLAVLAYTDAGFVPAIIDDAHPLADVGAITFLGTLVAEKHPEVKTWQVPPPSTVDEEKLITAKGTYTPLRNLEVANGYPVLQGYKNTAGIGYRLNFEDPLRFASLGITAAYTPETNLPSNQRGHIDVFGRYEFWTAELSWNRSDFYDLFGPTKRSRKGYAAKVGYDWILIYDEPRRLDAKFDIAWYDQIDTLPNAQNVETTFTRLLTSEAGLHYTDLRKSIGAVDDEKGLAWSVVYTGNQTQGATSPQLRGAFGAGLPLPLSNSSVWSWTAAGIADGAHNATLANYYFGGFGNNYVDDKSIKRYREYYSFPGFGINEISGLRFVKELVEVDPPPFVFESAGTPGLYLTWLRPSIFAGGLWTEPANASQRNSYMSIGAQADLRFTIFHWADMTLSVGAAIGYQGSQKSGTEWMISLKIL
jgi:hypothetical protein